MQRTKIYFAVGLLHGLAVQIQHNKANFCIALALQLLIALARTVL